MIRNRREFIATGVRAGAAWSVLGRPALALAQEPHTGDQGPVRAPHPLHILILGGTSFLGPHQIAYALSRGHSVSTFTRGRTQPTIHRKLFSDVEQLIGDRADNLEALRGRSWDAVIDNSGRQVAWTRDSARLLQDKADRYLYTSSTGVYYPYLGEDIREETEPLLEVPSGIDEGEAVEYRYGVMKANSEIEARRAFGEDRAIIVRPTYMMGPADRTDRFSHWPVRLARGGEVLVPGRCHDPVQYIDVRDVAGWMIRLLETQAAGTFNAVGPASPTGMHQFVHGAHAAFSSAATFVPIADYEFLTTHRIAFAIPWIMPTGGNAGSALVSNERGLANGLSLTPLAQSVRDIHEWWYSDAVTDERRAEMKSGERSLMAREAAIIARWRERD
jgi:nucleoside-diphosphate-sugar epimerase